MTDQEIMDPWNEHRVNGPYTVSAVVLTFARALLSASIADTAGAKPDGWKLVPTEPTEAMVRAACLKQSNAAFESYEAWHDSHSSGISARIRQLVASDYRVMIDAAPPAPSVADKRTLSDEQIAKAWFGDEYGPGHTRAPGYVYTFLEALDAPSVADAAGVSLPENIDWTRVMTLAEKHGDGWSNEKGWSFHCDDDLFNFAGELAKESGK